MNAEDPAKKGICSNFLCDAKPGAEVMMTGPTGQVMLLPKDPATPVIMVATGTGIAPMRSYIRRFFLEDVRSWEFKGLAWLFMGVANSDAKLYDDEFQECAKRFPGSVPHRLRALPRETPTRTAARCTSKTRLRSTRTRCSNSSTAARTCTSAASRV